MAHLDIHDGSIRDGSRQSLMVDRPPVLAASIRSQPNSSSTLQALFTSSGVESLAQFLR
jgi:hypothetical protein